MFTSIGHAVCPVWTVPCCFSCLSSDSKVAVCCGKIRCNKLECVPMDLFPNEQNFDLDKPRQKFHRSLKEYHKIITRGKLIPFFRKRYQFPVRNTKWLKNGKLRSAILSAFYNISQRNFGILLILSCSFRQWWNFCLDMSRSKFCSLGTDH
jgi:hypothetical protein